MHTPNGRDLLTPDELRNVTRKIAEQTNRAFTWHNLSLLTAKIVLAVWFVVWFGTLWWMINPRIFLWPIDPHDLFYALLSGAIAAGLGFACTTVPPIFWSSLIAQTPAAELMNKLYAKYGRTGFYIALAGALVFTVMGYNVFYA